MNEMLMNGMNEGKGLRVRDDTIHRCAIAIYLWIFLKFEDSLTRAIKY